MKKVTILIASAILCAVSIFSVFSNEKISYSLFDANIEALAQDESSSALPYYEMKRVLKQIQITGNVNVGMTINGTTITLGDIEAGFYAAWISCCVATSDSNMKCPFDYQNKDC